MKMPMECRYSHPGHLRELTDAQWRSEVLPKPRHYLRDPLPLRPKARDLPKTVACRPGKQAVKNLPMYQSRHDSNLARTFYKPRESEDAIEKLGTNCGSQCRRGRSDVAFIDIDVRHYFPREVQVYVNTQRGIWLLRGGVWYRKHRGAINCGQQKLVLIVKKDGLADRNLSLASNTHAHAGPVYVDCGRHRRGDAGDG
jgi:hypothetical protein